MDAINPRIRANPLHPEYWINATAKTFFIEELTLYASYRGREIQEYRMAAMWLARKFTGLSYPALARSFHKDDHTTIINGVRRAESDPKLALLIEEVLEYIESGMPA